MNRYGDCGNCAHCANCGRDNYGLLLQIETLLNTLYEEIRHGDDEHQKWLKDKIDEHFKHYYSGVK